MCVTIRRWRIFFCFDFSVEFPPDFPTPAPQQHNHNNNNHLLPLPLSSPRTFPFSLAIPLLAYLPFLLIDSITQ